MTSPVEQQQQQVAEPHTPQMRASSPGADREGALRVLTPIRERGGPKRRRKEGGARDQEIVKRSFTYCHFKAEGGEAKEAAAEQIPVCFAEDLMAPAAVESPSGALCRHAAKVSWPAASSEGLEASSAPTSKARTADTFSPSADIDYPRWFAPLQLGFSILVQGVGSKWRLLQDFADTMLIPWGAVVVRINGFDPHFSLCDCLREILEQVLPVAMHAGNSSAEALASTICSFLQGAEGSGRPICLVVHNLECLRPSDQAVLAGIAATVGAHLVASADKPLCLKNSWDFNFYREEVHTFEGYVREHHARLPHEDLPWL